VKADLVADGVAEASDLARVLARFMRAGVVPEVYEPDRSPVGTHVAQTEDVLQELPGGTRVIWFGELALDPTGGL
jgi:hypothetical protein